MPEHGWAGTELVGLHEAESPFEAHFIVRNEIQVSGSFAYTHANFSQAVEMLLAEHPQPCQRQLHLVGERGQALR